MKYLKKILSNILSIKRWVDLSYFMWQENMLLLEMIIAVSDHIILKHVFKLWKFPPLQAVYYALLGKIKPEEKETKSV